ncbi:MAG: methyl-accepting chemotaxis protein [Gammaproteobacteria bacterium]|nr:methyl-accepting chemotaxis protein [Gammaproteobacteria bacterium]
MHRFKIKTIAIVLAFLMGIAIAGRSATDYIQSRTIAAEADNMVSVDYRLSQYAHSVHLHVVQVQQWLTDISATRGQDGLDDGFNEAEKHAQMLRENIAAAMAMDGEHREQYEQFLAAFEPYYATGKAMAQAYVEYGTVAGNALMGDFDQAAAALGERMDPLLVRLEAKFVDSATNIKQDIDTLHNIGVMTAMILFAVLAFMIWVMQVQIVGSLRQVMQMTAEMAHGETDLNKRLNEQACGEVGEICRNVNQFISNTSAHINNISVISAKLTSSAEDLRHATDATHRVVEVQQRETDMVSTAMNEMAATVQEVANHALSAANAAHGADEAGKRGTQVMVQTVTAIKTLADSIMRAAEVIKQVDASSANINNVSQVISAIAEQTNLLALNAAIEAARAGEQGRGFAVVADEVRALAKRTQESIVEIRQTIDALQQAAHNAVSVMEQSQLHATDCVEDAQKTQQALQEIADAVSVINDMNTQIASASEQQGAVAEEINRNVLNIRSAAEEAVLESKKVATISAEIGESVSGLQGMLGQFKS